MPRELIFADNAIVALIVTEGIAPQLKRIESQVHGTVCVSVHQWAAGEERACGFCGPTQADHEGVARILCRPNYGGDRLIVGVHVFFGPELAPGTGYTGFLLNGSVETPGSVPELDIRYYTGLYNQPELRTRI
jgi:hypothetical protein